jgi:predicted alpha/beta-hydrolase family hydrolase
MRTRRLRWLWFLLLVPLLLVGGFVAWAQAVPAPMPEAVAALASDEEVEVSATPWLVFRPRDKEPRVGIVLYPGGRVDPRAYAPAARALARQGHLVVIVPMPLNLAFFRPSAASQVIDAFPEVTRWAVGGHSLGGAMAARFAYRSSGAADGLVLWASYPAESDDLSDRGIAVSSIYGTRDGLATLEKIDASRPLLPPSTFWVPVEGGNHAQFGWYGPQAGDNQATIGRAEQQQQIIEATDRLLRTLAEE